MKKRRMSSFLKLFLCIFWIFTIILPVSRLFSYLASVDVRKIIFSVRFADALRHSLFVSSAATLISVGLAWIVAGSVVRTEIKHKTVITTIVTVPMLIPSISHGMGLIIVLGSNGWLSRLLGISGGIYGSAGIVIGSVLYSFPVAYLMFYDILTYEDGAQYEVAEIIGLKSRDRFRAITLPYLRKPLISVLFAVFTMIITDYGVPLMVGGKYLTLPVMMYQDVIGMLDFGKGSVIGVVLLIPAFMACILDIINRDNGNLSYVSVPFRIKKNILRDSVARAIIIILGILIFFPVVSFSILGFLKKYPIDLSFTFSNISQAVGMGALQFLKNSLLISVSVALLGTAVALFNAYMTARNKTKFCHFLHLLSVVSLAIPGIVLGLAYVLFFKKSLIYGTFAILILVNSIHFFASPYLMAYNCFGKINPNLENVGQTMGLSKWSIVRSVILPQSAGTVVEMMSYFFVNSMMTISAVSFLANIRIKPIALMITQFEGQMQLECAAFVSLLILVVNILMKCVIFTIKKKSAGSF